MKIIANGLLLLGLGWVGAASAGEMMTFPTNGQTLPDREVGQGSLAIGGLTLNLTAGVEGADTPSLLPVVVRDGEILGIGVRSGGSRWGAVQRGESLTLTFDHEVVLRQLDLALIGLELDAAVTVVVGPDAPFRVYGKGDASTVEPAVEGVTFEGVQDIVTFTGDGKKLRAGDSIRLSFDKTNQAKKGFILSSLTVEREAPPLDAEPS